MSQRKLARAVDDELPLDAVRLNVAFERVAEIATQTRHSLVLPNNEWREAIRRSHEQDFAEVADLEEYGAEDSEFWRRRREAHIYFRACLAAGQLTAFVQDPDQNVVVELGKQGWLPTEWLGEKAYVPDGIYDEFIDPSDYESKGPPGSYLNKKIRPVFFERLRFEQWFKSTFPSATEQIISSRHWLVPHDHKRKSVTEALIDLYSASTLIGIPAGDRYKQVNAWLTARGKRTASPATIRRALQELRTKSL